MKIIKSWQDVQNLMNSPLSSPVKCYVAEYFLQLHESLGDSEPLDKFYLEIHGSIAILDNPKDTNDLSALDLPSLIETCPEYVESHGPIVRVGILICNDVMDSIIIPKSIIGDLDADTQEWLRDYCNDIT